MTYDRALLKKELTRDEGVRLAAYQDSVGLWTIGVGHLIDDGKTPPRVMRITEAEAQAWLDLDIADAEAKLFKVFPHWDTDFTPVRQRALLNMAFNLGNRLLQFQKFRALMQVGNYEEAAKEMLRSLWAKQVGARAMRLSEMISKGE